MKRIIGLLVACFLMLPLTGTALAESATVALRPGGASCTAPGGATSTADPVGFVMMNSAGKPGTPGKLIFNVQLMQGAPDTTYEVRVHRVGDSPNCANAGGGQPVRGTFTTDSNGHGHANVQVSGFDVAGANRYFVTLNDQATAVPPAEFASDSAELD